MEYTIISHSKWFWNLKDFFFSESLLCWCERLAKEKWKIQIQFQFHFHIHIHMYEMWWSNWTKMKQKKKKKKKFDRKSFERPQTIEAISGKLQFYQSSCCNTPNPPTHNCLQSDICVERTKTNFVLIVVVVTTTWICIYAVPSPLLLLWLSATFRWLNRQRFDHKSNGNKNKCNQHHVIVDERRRKMSPTSSSWPSTGCDKLPSAI